MAIKRAVSLVNQRQHLMTVGFLKMLKNNFRHQQAYKLAVEGFTNFMIEYYKLVLSGTKPYSQERFDKFRQHYTEVASKISYLRIVESSPNILKVRFKRCPFCKVMKRYNLEDFSQAYCMSDPGFTKTILPGVEFHRKHTICKGSKYCDNTWTF